MGMWMMMKRRRRKQQQEAALRLSVSFHIQVYSHICTQTQAAMHKHTPGWEVGVVCSCTFVLKRSDSHARIQMNQAVNAKCLLTERLQNESRFQLLPLAGALICAQEHADPPSSDTHTHTHGHFTLEQTCTHKHSCKYQGLLYVLHSHIQLHTHTHRGTCLLW